MAEPQGSVSGRPRSGRWGIWLGALVAGVAGGMVAPLVYPVVARGARPAAKRAIKAGIAAFEQGRVATAEWAEHASDLLAEARAEYTAEQNGAHDGSHQSAANEVLQLRGASAGSPGRGAASP